MPSSRPAKMVLASVLVLCLLAAPLRAGKDEPPSKQKVAGLIQQLDSDTYAEREAATKALLEMGSVVSPALEEALKGGGLSPEAAERVRRILKKVYVPQCGAVWRGLGRIKIAHGSPVLASPPWGLKNGDVAIQLDEVDIRSVRDLNRHVKSRGKYELTIWRKGEGKTKLTTQLDRRAADSFRNWPDEAELYRRFGHRGPWDRQVDKALGFAGRDDPNALAGFRAAWKAGCRDAMVLTNWLIAMGTAGRTEEALKLASSEAGQVKGTYPGGKYRYGLLPSRTCWLRMLAGRRKEAAALLEDAARKASEAKASQALVPIRRRQLELKLLESPAAAWKFIEAQREQLRLADLSDGEMVNIAETLAGEGDPARALAFCQLLGAAPEAPGLKATYQRQQELSRKHRTAGPTKRRAVPVWRWELPVALRAPRNMRTLQSLNPLPAACRFEFEMRMADFPTARAFFPAGAGAQLFLARRSASASILATRLGEAAMNSTARPASVGDCLFLGSVKAWRKVTFDVSPNVVRVAIDGRTVRTWYHQREWPDTAMPIIMGGSCRAEFRNFRAYVDSEAKADSAKIERALVGLRQAMLAGEVNEARRHHVVLQDAWASVPEAQPFAERAARIFKLYEALFSAEGLALCRQEILDDPLIVKLGDWRLEEDDWLVLHSDGKPAFPRLQLPLITPDIEITGIIQLDSPGKKTEWQILWNCHWTTWWDPQCDRGNAFLKYWPAGPKVFLGAYHDRMRVKKLDKSVANGPLPFCIRVRGDKASLFLQDASKPLILFSGTRRRIYSFNLRSIYPGKGTRVRFGCIVVRHLPKDRKLDAPAELPKLKPAFGGGIDPQVDL